jgi:hypothetical protein
MNVMQTKPDQYEKLADKPYDSLYFHAETVIDQPIEKVWRHALDIGSWMSSHKLETLDGKRGEVGHFEKVSPHGVGPDVPLPHHHLYGIGAVIPMKFIGLEVLPEKGGSYGTKDWVSFDGILFTDLGGKTHITFHMVDVHLKKADPVALERRKAEIEAGRKLMDRHFENLWRLVSE